VPARDGIGANIAAARKLRGLSQHELARVAFVSFSLLSKVESGHKPASPRLIADVAQALRVNPAELTGQPYRGETPDEDAIHAPIAELRHEIIVYDLPPRDYDQPVPDLASLAQSVGKATRLRQAGSYAKLGADLPGLLRDLRAAAHTFTGTDQERVFGLLAESYDNARALAYKLGYLDLASLLVTRHAHAAARSSDPLEVAVGDTMRAHEMISVGEFRAAESLMDASLARVEPDVRDDHPATIAVYGYLHLEAALAAARRGDRVDADHRLSEAREAATRIGADRDDYRLAFGPTNVAIWSVALPVEYGDPVPALERAEAIHLPGGTPRERSSHYYIDLGRAHLQLGKLRDALDALITARRHSPLHTRYHPMVRETTRTISRHMHRRDETLAAFTNWLGLKA
jgi:transcriptional regulator with XRE-family HTH domain